MPKDYYEILGVSRSATQEEIKKAYKRLAKKYHPDVSKEADASDRFKEVNEAAAVLGNEEKRRTYDQAGHEAFTQAGRGGVNPNDFQGGGFNGVDIDDIFEMFTGGAFGGSHGRRARRPARGDDLRYDVELSLEDAASGITRTVRVRKHAPCDTCDGKGGKDVRTCTTCHGAGYVRQAQRTPFGVFQSTGPCRACGGAGQTIHDPCSQCDGTGVIAATKELEIKIPAGVESGTRLRVTGEGDAGPRGAAAGDLYLFITVREHRVFERRGADLHLDAPVSFATLALGGTVTVPTINGEADVKIPHGTQSHTVLRLRGKGMPEMDGGNGDLYVRVIARTPEKLTKRQQKALEEFGQDDDEQGWLGALFDRIKKGL